MGLVHSQLDTHAPHLEGPTLASLHADTTDCAAEGTKSGTLRDLVAWMLVTMLGLKAGTLSAAKALFCLGLTSHRMIKGRGIRQSTHHQANSNMTYLRRGCVRMSAAIVFLKVGVFKPVLCCVFTTCKLRSVYRR